MGIQLSPVGLWGGCRGSGQGFPNVLHLCATQHASQLTSTEAAQQQQEQTKTRKEPARNMELLPKLEILLMTQPDHAWTFTLGNQSDHPRQSLLRMLLPATAAS